MTVNRFSHLWTSCFTAAAACVLFLTPALADSGLPPGLYGTTEGGQLYSIDPDTGSSSHVLTVSAAAVYDIAFDAAGDLWVLERNDSQNPAYRLHLYDPGTGGLLLQTGACALQNGLDTRGSDDVLLASGGTNFYIQDKSSPTCPVSIGIGDQSAGDVADSPGGRVFVTARGLLSGDSLIEVDVGAGSSWRVGGLANPCGGLFAPTWEGLEFLDDGRMMATTRGWGCNRVVILDPDTTEILQSREISVEIAGIAVRRSGDCPPPIISGTPAVSDVDPCEPGLLVEWEPAVWAPSAGGGVYNVYRGEPDCSAPLAPVALGLASSPFLDTDTIEGTTYSYVIEAEDASGCGSGPFQSGMTARTSCSPAIADAADREAPPDRAGNTLLAEKLSFVHTRLLWTADGLLAGESIAVARSAAKDGPFEILPPFPATSPFVDDDELTTTRIWYYLVITVDECGNRSD